MAKPAAPEQTSLQAFLFTDIVGSTDLKRHRAVADRMNADMTWTHTPPWKRGRYRSGRTC